MKNNRMKSIAVFSGKAKSEERTEKISKSRGKLSSDRKVTTSKKSSASKIAPYSKKSSGRKKANSVMTKTIAGSPLRSTYPQSPSKPTTINHSTSMRELSLYKITNYPIQIGVWDLGCRLGFLLDVLMHLNVSQELFNFKQVYSSIPAGLVSKPSRIQEWAKQKLSRIPKSMRDSLTENVIANDYFERAKAIRRGLELDILTGIVPSMIAGEEEDLIYINHFASETETGREGIISTYSMREYAEMAGRPVEAAIAGVLISQIMVSLNRNIEYHDETRGCIFDYNESRDGIVESIQKCQIDDLCMGLIDERYRKTAEQLMKRLSKYKRKKG